MAIKDLAELIKKFTQKDKFKPTAVQVIKSAKNPPVPAQNEDISVPSEGERIHFLNTGALGLHSSSERRPIRSR